MLFQLQDFRLPRKVILQAWHSSPLQKAPRSTPRGHSCPPQATDFTPCNRMQDIPNTKTLHRLPHPQGLSTGTSTAILWRSGIFAHLQTQQTDRLCEGDTHRHCRRRVRELRYLESSLPDLAQHSTGFRLPTALAAAAHLIPSCGAFLRTHILCASSVPLRLSETFHAAAARPFAHSFVHTRSLRAFCCRCRGRQDPSKCTCQSLHRTGVSWLRHGGHNLSN